MPAKRIDTLAAFVPTPVARAAFMHAVNNSDLTIASHAHAEYLPAAVLFADISGFTALTEKLTAHHPQGSEELTALLNLYFTGIIGFIKRYGGQVVKFSGDALIAFFPADEASPAAMTLVTQQAVYAAEALQMATANFQHLRSSIGEIALVLKVAVGAGNVLAAHVGGVFDRWEYVIAGDPLTQVAEAERHAKPGMIVLSAQAAISVGSCQLPDGAQLVWSSGEKEQAAFPSASDMLTPQPSSDWSSLSIPMLEQIESMLRAYVPAAITARLAVGQDDWLAEFRRMTIMFVGVGGIDYDHTDVLDHLQAFVAAAQETIYRYEGSLNKLSVDDKGTVLLVLFGAPPLAHEDDPQRALACAQELQAIAAKGLAVQATTEDSSPRLFLRMAIGITTDTVFAGPVGSPSRREYTVMGDTVNLAVRLMQAAGAGNILCDTTTATLSQNRWRLERLSPMTVKGKTYPVDVHRLLGQQRFIRTPTAKPLVNRDQELATLITCLETTQRGTSCIVALVGEGGMGKTRLAHELMTAALQRHVPYIVGEASSTGQQTPYSVWRDVLTNYFDLDGLRGAEQRAERVRAHIHTIDADLELRLPLLDDILNLELPDTAFTRGMNPQQRRDNLVFLLIELLLHRVQTGALLLVLEDMHLADSRSWEVALDVARALALRPIMLLLVYRSLRDRRDMPIHAPAQHYLHETREQIGIREAAFVSTNEAPQHAITRLRGYQELHLTALNQAEVARLAAYHLDDLPLAPALADWLSERSQGNPFFVEEIIKILRDDEALQINKDNEWKRRGESTNLSLFRQL